MALTTPTTLAAVDAQNKAASDLAGLAAQRDTIVAQIAGFVQAGTALASTYPAAAPELAALKADFIAKAKTALAG